MAVSDAGVFARVSQREDLHRLVAIPRPGIDRVLDNNLPGSLANLAFNGAALTWTHDGVARSEVP